MTFPHRFDTTEALRKVVRFGLALVGVLTAGILYSLLVSRDYVVAAQLAVIIAMLAWFASLVMQHGGGSVGVLTREAVTVERGPVMLGMRFAGPQGRFAIDAFECIRLEQASGPVDASIQGGPHGRIYLAGKAGTPDVLIARVQGVGVEAAQEFADALGLRLYDTRTPY